METEYFTLSLSRNSAVITIQKANQCQIRQLIRIILKKVFSFKRIQTQRILCHSN